MRFVPTYCIREGMMLGKNLLGKDGSLLLSQGQIIKKSYIEKIMQLGYSGIYISDNISEDIVIHAIIDDQLKTAAVKAIKDMFIYSRQEKAAEDSENIINRTRDIVGELVDQILNNDNAIVNMIDLKVFDDYTFYHSVNVAVLSIVIGVGLNFGKTELYKLGLSALLHDIGKVFINKDIIDKKGKLTPEEFEEVKKHPQLGYNYLEDKFEIPVKSYLGALQHHEKFDGSGYPEQIKGTQISTFGRIISIADVYDALTSDRPYRKAMLPSEAMEYIMGGAGTIFDPMFVRIFTRRVAAYPLGTCVVLSNGQIGIVTENYEDCCIRPKIRIINNDGTPSDEPVYINLRNDLKARNITIKDIANV